MSAKVNFDDLFSKASDRAKSGAKQSFGMIGDAVLFKLSEGVLEDVEHNAEYLELKGTILAGGPKEYIGKEVAIHISGDSKKVQENLEQGFKPGKVTTSEILVEGVTFNDGGVASGKWAHKAGGSARRIQMGMSGPLHLSFTEPTEGGKFKRVNVFGENPSKSELNQVADAFDRMNDARDSGDAKRIMSSAIRVSREMFFPDEARATTTKTLVDDIIAMSEKADGVSVRFVDGDSLATSRKLAIYSVKNAEPVKKQEVAGGLVSDMLAYMMRSKDDNGLGLESEVTHFMGLRASGDLRMDLIPSRYFAVPFNAADASKSSTDREIRNFLNSSDRQRDFRGLMNPVSAMGEALMVVPAALVTTPYKNEKGEIVDNSFIKFVQSSGAPVSLTEIKTDIIPEAKNILAAKGVTAVAEESHEAASAAPEEDHDHVETPSEVPEDVFGDLPANLFAGTEGEGVDDDVVPGMSQ